MVIGNREARSWGAFSISSMTNRLGDTRTRTFEPIGKAAWLSHSPLTRSCGTKSGLPLAKRVTVRRRRLVLQDADLVLGEGASVFDGMSVVESSIAMIILYSGWLWSGVWRCSLHRQAPLIDLINSRYYTISV